VNIGIRLIDTVVVLADRTRCPLNLRGARPETLVFQGRSYKLAWSKAGIGYYTAGVPVRLAVAS
jgi:hypothetical protein